MNREIYEKYAQLLLKAGVNLQRGQNLLVKGEFVHMDFVNIIEEQAYKMGARYVEADFENPQSTVNRSCHQQDEFLGYIPSYMKNKVDYLSQERWSLIRLDGKADPAVYEKINQERDLSYKKNMRELQKPLMSSFFSGECAWSIACVPTLKWAEQVFGSESGEAVNTFWETLIPIVRLNADDPIAEWKKHSDLLATRCAYLNNSGFNHLHFTGPDTDLHVYLNDRSRWLGGSDKTPEGNIFFPNLPTEEVFTTPNFKKTHGKVRVTRPVSVLDNTVLDAWFIFEEGRVVDYGASKGKDMLDTYFKMDPNARFLGEVALVDVSSPVFQSGKIFNNILLDENAACHIALGRGISGAIKDAEGYNEEQLSEVGCNDSILHTDFMIGSVDVSVVADIDGKYETTIIDKGVFKEKG